MSKSQYLVDWHRRNPGKAKEYYDRAYAKHRHSLAIIIRSIKTRSKKCGIPCTITEADVVPPEFCPVLGIRLVRGFGGATDASPSVDRIRPELGYVPGNVAVISKRANTIKSNATVAELRAIADWLEKQV